MGTVLKFIFKLLITILTLVINIFADIFSILFSSGRKEKYEADFVFVGSVFSRYNKGLCITGNRSLTIEESFSHVVAFGSSGSRKTVSLIFPNCFRLVGKGSLIILDSASEIHPKTSGFIKQNGYKIKILNFSKPEISEGFNFLAKCKSYSDVLKIVDAFFRNTSEQTVDVFWDKSAASLCALFGYYLLQYGKPEEKNFASILHMLNVYSVEPEKVDALFVVRAEDENFILQYKSFNAFPEKVRMSIVATAISALQIFEDPNVKIVTSFDSIDFSDLRNELTALYICNSIKDAHYFRALTAAFFECFWGEILSELPSKKQLPLFFLMDEVSSMKLPSLPLTIANLRKYRSSLLLLFQDYHQLEHLYGAYQAKNIVANCLVKIYLPGGQPIEVCKMLETTLGKYEYLDEKEVRRVRELLTAQEIRQLDKALILHSNKPPVLARMVPYFEQWKMRKYANLPPYFSKEKNQADKIPGIEFEK